MKKVNAVVGQTPEKFSQKRLPRLPLILVAIVAGAIGTYAIIHSLAATDPNLLFNGTQTSDYLVQSAPGAITEVPDPLGSGQTVFKMTVNNADVAPITPTNNPRAELVGPSDINNGDTVWLKTKFFLPSDFPSSVPGWLDLMEIYGEPFNGPSPWNVEVKGNQIQWQRNGTYNYDIPWSMPIVKNQWVTVLLHEQLGSNGYVEMWINGQPVTFFSKTSSDYYNPNNVSSTTHLAMQTMDASNNGGTNSGRIMQYRQVNMFDSVTTYSAPLIIGTTQAAVDTADATDGGATTSTPAPTPPPADTTAPTVSLTAPAQGATVSGQVPLSANASDNVGVTKVEFYADGNLVATDTSAPYAATWSATNAAAGNHTITAKAYDAANNVGTATVTVNIAAPTPAPDTTPPSTPTNLSATATSASQVNLTWNASTDTGGSGLAGYNIYRNGTKLNSSLITSNTYTDTAVAASTAYSYTVQAVDGAGNLSTNSAPATVTTPTAPDTTPPTVSFASPANNATVSGIVTATANASDNVGVTKVDFSLDGTTQLTDTASPYNYSFDSKTLSNGSHTITAKAYDAAGNSSTSTITVNVNNPDTTPPNAPTGLAATTPNPTTVNLTWNTATDTGANPTGVVKYNVLRDGIVIAQPTTTSYTDTAAVASTAYSYTVQAVDGAGNVSANSNTVSVTTPASASPNLLFYGTQISDYLNQSAPGAVTAVPDPAGSSQQVFKMVVSNADVYPITPTAGPRAQLVSPAILNNGDDFWWSAKFYLPSDFPSSVPAPGWLNVLEGAYGPPFNGTPPWEVTVVNSDLRWQRNGTYNWDVPWSMPLVKNQWVSVMVHEKLATNGFIEMWVNGQQVTFFTNKNSFIYNPNNVASTQQLNMQTWDASNDGGPNFEVIQSYRQQNIFNSVTLYQWPMKIGTTEASVDNSSSSPPPAAVPDTTPPSVPTNVSATAVNSSQVNLSWSASTDTGGSGLAGYNIYRNGTKLNSSLVTSTSYGDSTVSASTAYSYTVQAVDGAGNTSAKSTTATATTPAAPDTTPPSTPTNLQATAASASQVNLTWNASTDSGGSGLAGYNVYRNGTKLNSSLVTGTSYSDNSVAAGTTYSYQVEAVDGAGNKSAQTSTVNVTTPSAPSTPSTGTHHGSHHHGQSTSSTSSSVGSAAVTLTVTGVGSTPVAGAAVTVGSQTVTTDNNGVASFTGVPGGSQTVTVSYNGKTTTKAIQVKGSSTQTPQLFKVSVVRDKFSPGLLLIPVIVLLAAGGFLMRPWEKFSGAASTGDDVADHIVTSSQPTETSQVPVGRKLETPGTVYSPKESKNDKPTQHI